MPQAKHRRMPWLRSAILLSAMTAALLMTFGTPAVPNSATPGAAHVGAPVAVAHAATTPNPDDWDTYQNGAVYVPNTPGLYGHAGFNAQEALPQGTQSNPGLQLNPNWPQTNGIHEVPASEAISSQPVVATITPQSPPQQPEQIVYWGAWNGNETATLASSGQQLWSTSLGTFTPKANQNCQLPSAGPASAATMTGLTDAQGYPILVVVGNNQAAVPGVAGTPSIPTLYGLDAFTGAIDWHVTLAPTGQTPDPNSFGWDAPAVYSYTDMQGTHWLAYVGLSS
jgi:hypothetical protein